MSQSKSNPLLLAYSKKQNPIPFSRNNLLANNTMFMMNQTAVAQNVNKLKQENVVKKIQQQNEKKQSTEQNLLLNAIIQPTKLEKHNEDINPKYDNRKQLWGNEAQNWRNHRTNEPYKNIITENQIKLKDKIINVKKGKDVRENHVEDLVVYKVTAEDKKSSVDEIKKDFDDNEKKRKEHDDENKVIYSASHLAEKKKEFEFKHKYMYRIKQHDDLQKSHVDYFQNMQSQMEKDKKRYDDILNAVLDKEDIIESNQIKQTLSDATTESSLLVKVTNKPLLKVIDDVD